MHDPTLLLPAFHTAFNVVGMFIALPFIGLFSRFIITILPDRGPALTRHLDFSVTSIPAVAIETARRTVRSITLALIEAVTMEMTDSSIAKTSQKLSAIDDALAQTRIFIGGIRSRNGSTSKERMRHIEVLHVIDHCEILSQQCRETSHIQLFDKDESMRFIALELCDKFQMIMKRLNSDNQSGPFEFAEETSLMMTDVRKKERERILQRTAMGEITPDDAYHKIEALRWLDRIAYRVWRAAYHLGDNQTGKQIKRS
jgi:phosphate:Na+ symporter